jgi:DNA-binding Lrp family transcriptional regulator
LNDATITILRELARDVRTPLADLAAMAGVSEPEAEAIIAQLEEQRVIRGHHALVDWEKAGVERIFAIIEVRVRPEHDVGFDAVAHRISLFDEVHSLYLMSGQYDLAAVVEGDSLKDVAAFVAEKLAPLSGVVSTSTSFVLKRYKTEGKILFEEREDWRLPVTP